MLALKGVRAVAGGGAERAAAVTLALRIGSKGFTFVSTVLLARFLGARDYGVLAYAIAWATLLSTPAVVGMDRVLTRYLARYQAFGEWGLMRGLLRYADRLVGIVSVSLASAAALLGAMLLSPTYRGSFVIAMAVVPVAALTAVRQGALQGLNHVEASFAPQMAIAPGLLVALLIAVRVAFPQWLTPAGGVALTLFASAVALGAGVVLLRRLTPSRARSQAPQFAAGDWIKGAVPQSAIATTSIGSSQLIIVILGLLAAPRAVAIFQVAAKLADLLGIVLVAINGPLAPAAARLHATGEIERLKAVTRRAAWVTFLITLPLACLMVGCQSWFLPIFGASFAGTGTVLTILVAAQLIDALSGPVGVLMIMTGHERPVASVMIVALAVSVALAVFLIPAWGATGAAASRAFYLISWNVVLAVMTYHRLGVNASVFTLATRRRYLAAQPSE